VDRKFLLRGVSVARSRKSKKSNLGDKMAITAMMVKELREKTNAGMLDCKKALEETNGNFEEAVDWLRKKGLSAAAKKADRLASEGLVQAFKTADGKVAVVVEVNSETDFVARNDQFKTFVSDVAAHVAQAAAGGVCEPATALLEQKYAKNNALTVNDFLKQSIATIGENLVIRRYAKYEANQSLVHTYIHGEGKIGVLIEVAADKAEALVNEAFKTFVNDICLHIAAMNPMATSDAEIPADAKTREREVLVGKAKEQGKKPEMIDKIVDGQMKKWLAENCLLEQQFVKNPDLSVAAYLKQTATSTGANLTIKRFVRFELGAGLQKKQENFAEEVAAQMKGR
jgi:elongation factor Ts